MSLLTDLQAMKTSVDASVATARADTAALRARIASKEALPAWRKAAAEVDVLKLQRGHSEFLAERIAAEARKLARQVATVQAGGSVTVTIPTPASSLGATASIPKRPSRGSSG
jgi:hypothetical protein